MKRLLSFATIALALAACSPNQKAETSSVSTKPSIQEVLTSSKTLDGTARHRQAKQNYAFTELKFQLAERFLCTSIQLQ